MPAIAVILLVLLLRTAALAAEAVPDLPPGTNPWGDDPLAGARLLAATPPNGSLTVVTPTDAPVRGTVLELRTSGPSEHPWSLQASMTSTAALAAGDVVYAECWLRTVASAAESGEGRALIAIEADAAPWSKITTARFAAPTAPATSGGWVRQACVGKAGEAFAPGRARLNLQLGFDRPQTIQVCGLRVRNLGPGVDPGTLPVPRASYPGMAPNAPWRAAAAARIELHRKGDLAVRVVDADGAPVAGAAIALRMRRHAFPFGSAVVPSLLLAADADGERYRAWVLRNCTRVVLENQLKWRGWEGGAEPGVATKDSRATTLAGLRWLADHGIHAKGHVLVWPGWRNLPPRLKPLADDPAALRAACDAHIADIMAATAPYGLVEWDVVNEAWNNRDLVGVLGRGELARWFTLARAGFPHGGLLYNDYAPLDPDREGAFCGFVEDLVLELKRGGAPITGLGIQSHYGASSLADPALIAGELARLAGKLDLDLAISEFDLGMDPRDAATQAAFTRDFMTVCFAEPRVASFLMWGFWAGAHWRPDAALFERDWTARPNAAAWEALVHGAWWTEADGTAGADGGWTVRGFKGDYLVTVSTADGRRAGSAAVIGDAPATLRIALPR